VGVAGHEGHHHAGGSLADRAARLADRRQGGRDVIHEFDVVEADDRDVLRNPEAATLHLADEAAGHLVAGAEDRRRAVRHRHPVAGAAPARIEREVAGEEPVRPDGQAARGQLRARALGAGPGEDVVVGPIRCPIRRWPSRARCAMASRAPAALSIRILGARAPRSIRRP
jgi:hypothetical protein